MIAAVLAWSLIFYPPAFKSTLPRSCPLGCTSGGISTDSCKTLASAFIVRHQQSRTWVANADSINAQLRRGDQSLLALLWPTIRSEAAWQGYGIVPMTRADVGKLKVIAISDTSHAYWYAVCGRDSSGAQGCIGAEVWRP